MFNNDCGTISSCLDKGKSTQVYQSTLSLKTNKLRLNQNFFIAGLDRYKSCVDGFSSSSSHCINVLRSGSCICFSRRTSGGYCGSHESSLAEFSSTSSSSSSSICTVLTASGYSHGYRRCRKER